MLSEIQTRVSVLQKMRKEVAVEKYEKEKVAACPVDDADSSGAAHIRDGLIGDLRSWPRHRAPPHCGRYLQLHPVAVAKEVYDPLKLCPITPCGSKLAARDFASAFANPVAPARLPGAATIHKGREAPPIMV